MAGVARAPELQMMDLETPLPTYKRPPTPGNTLDTAIVRAQKALATPQSIQLFTTRPRFSVHPFAFEPMIGNIIDFTWDARGRMWALETTDYPNVVLPDSIPGHDRILILEDNDHDGRVVTRLSGAHEQQHLGRRVHRGRFHLRLDGQQSPDAVRAHPAALLQKRRPARYGAPGHLGPIRHLPEHEHHAGGPVREIH